ncbi:TOG array regulator of axonemal microtubules protein 2-like isoform X2 [Pseudophryne corroboree]|uniref:TOG array regulator of axonemal microtubules protein 2-like isoform X2 n=1 Tax=Pseudophryne corroboree TaxID=495146 RepID=UPI0030818CFD
MRRPALPSIRTVHLAPADFHHASAWNQPISLETSADLNKPACHLTLPSIQTVTRYTTSFHHPSACPVPVTYPECSEGDSNLWNGSPGSHPMPNPEQGLIEALKCLNHKDWEKKQKGEFPGFLAP